MAVRVGSSGRLFCLLLLLLLAGAMVIAPARADNFSVLRSLIESGKYDEARALSAHASANTETNKLNLAFTEALILKVQGHYKEAAAAMRAILSDHPDLTRVRGELADTLMRMGDTEGAKFNFQLLADSSTDAAQRGFYDRYLDTIRRKRPWTLDTFVSLAPSTNINNGISGDTVVIGGVPFDAASHTKKSGIGASAGIAGTYRFDLRPGWAFTVGGNANGDFYSDSTFDQLNLSSFGELAHEMGPWRFGVGMFADRVLMGWNGYNWDYGVQLSAKHDLGRNDAVLGSLAWKRITYDDIDALSGDQFDVGLRYRKAVSPSFSYGFGMTYTRLDTETPFNGYNGYKPSLEIYRELHGGLLATAQLSYQWRDYLADFPLMGERRADQELDLDLGMTFRKWSWQGFAPKVDYRFSHNQSNVDLYRYDSHAVSFSLTRRY